MYTVAAIVAEALVATTAAAAAVVAAVAATTTKVLFDMFRLSWHKAVAVVVVVVAVVGAAMRGGLTKQHACHVSGYGGWYQYQSVACKVFFHSSLSSELRMKPNKSTKKSSNCCKAFVHINFSMQFACCLYVFSVDSKHNCELDRSEHDDWFMAIYFFYLFILMILFDFC